MSKVVVSLDDLAEQKCCAEEARSALATPAKQQMEPINVASLQPAFPVFFDLSAGIAECLARLSDAEKMIGDVRCTLEEVSLQAAASPGNGPQDDNFCAPIDPQNGDPKKLVELCAPAADELALGTASDVATAVVPQKEDSRIAKEWQKKHATDQKLKTAMEAHKNQDAFPAAEKGSIRWLAQRILKHKYFESFIGFVIMANAVTIGIDNDNSMQQPDEPQNEVIGVLERVFAVIYMVELVLRILAWKCKKFFISQDWRWNWFDTLLVVASLYEFAMEFLEVGAMNMTFGRLMRILKMAKMLRVVRLTKMFRELRLIMNSVQGSIPTMCWSMVLIILTTFIFGICILQACASYKADNKGAIDDKELELLTVYWGSMPQAMLTLYWASTGGDSWRFIGEPLKTVGFAFYAVFMVYIAFFMLVIVNTLSSLFLEATLRNAETDQEQKVQEELMKKNDIMKSLTALFNDADRQGGVTFEEFCDKLECDEITEFCRKVELDIQDACTFFSILSGDGKNPVSLDAFVTGCMKMKGTAKSIDLLALMNMTANFVDEFKEDLNSLKRSADEKRGLKAVSSGASKV